MTKAFLDSAYNLDGADETRNFYNDWADTYDAEVAENGYATPGRCAAALAEFSGDLALPLLDIGCGTGISGAAFSAAGFGTIDGSDFSDEMLARAKLKGVYRTLLKADLTNPLPFDTGAYPAISAVGVLNPGHAPASTLDEILGKLPKGGHFVFSLNDHALEDKSYEGRLSEHVDCGNAELMYKDYGDHLPKIGLKSNVYVLRKT